MERLKFYFKLDKRNTTFKTEVIAGATCFMAMAYILMVNAGMFSKLDGVSFDAIYIATACASVFGTILVGVFSNLPVGISTGMGLNAFFAYTVCTVTGFTYANALVLTLGNGIIFIILTLTGVREKMFYAIPTCVRCSIPAGIGLFVAFLGFKNSGLIVPSDSTLVGMTSFNMLDKNVTWAQIMPILVTIITLMIIAALSIKRVKGSIFWGLILGTALYYIFGLTIKDFYDDFLNGLSFNPGHAFKMFFKEAFGKVFSEGFDFSVYLKTHSVLELSISFTSLLLAFCMIDMFGSMSTFYSICTKADILTKDGRIPNFKATMFSDSVSIIFASIFGTATVTPFVESSAGVAEGGKTGLAALTTGILFFISIFFSPLAKLIPSCAMAATLIYVGILMMGSITDIDWSDISEALPAFMTIVMMPFTNNVSYGIAFGFFSFVLTRALTGQFQKVRPATWIVSILFVVMFLVTSA